MNDHGYEYVDVNDHGYVDVNDYDCVDMDDHDERAQFCRYTYLNSIFNQQEQTNERQYLSTREPNLPIFER